MLNAKHDRNNTKRKNPNKVKTILKRKIYRIIQKKLNVIKAEIVTSYVFLVLVFRIKDA